MTASYRSALRFVELISSANLLMEISRPASWKKLKGRCCGGFRLSRPVSELVSSGLFSDQTAYRKRREEGILKEACRVRKTTLYPIGAAFSPKGIIAISSRVLHPDSSFTPKASGESNPTIHALFPTERFSTSNVSIFRLSASSSAAPGVFTPRSSPGDRSPGRCVPEPFHQPRGRREDYATRAVPERYGGFPQLFHCTTLTYRETPR
jgi:hypothetical protein